MLMVCVLSIKAVTLASITSARQLIQLIKLVPDIQVVGKNMAYGDGKYLSAECGKPDPAAHRAISKRRENEELPLVTQFHMHKGLHQTLKQVKEQLKKKKWLKGKKERLVSCERVHNYIIKEKQKTIFKSLTCSISCLSGTDGSHFLAKFRL